MNPPSCPWACDEATILLMLGRLILSFAFGAAFHSTIPETRGASIRQEVSGKRWKCPPASATYLLSGLHHAAQGNRPASCIWLGSASDRYQSRS